jgi:hypothetical protein
MTRVSIYHARDMKHLVYNLFRYTHHDVYVKKNKTKIDAGSLSVSTSHWKGFQCRAGTKRILYCSLEENCHSLYDMIIIIV